MNETWTVAIPTVVVLVGILMNRQDSTAIRSEMGTLRGDLGGLIDMLTGKVIELTDRVSHLDASIGK